MYVLHSRLNYDSKLVGLRFINKINGAFSDFNIKHLGNVDLGVVTEVLEKRLRNVENLKDIGGVLVTSWEDYNKKVVKEIPHEDIPFIQKMLLGRYTNEQCEKVAKKLYKEVMEFDGIGAKGKRVHLNGKSAIENPNTIYYAIVVEVKTGYNFNWNTDDDYNESQHDTHGIITNDKKFEDWQNHAILRAVEHMKQTGLVVKAEVDASKYALYVSISASSGSIYD